MSDDDITKAFKKEKKKEHSINNKIGFSVSQSPLTYAIDELTSKRKHISIIEKRRATNEFPYSVLSNKIESNYIIDWWNMVEATLSSYAQQNNIPFTKIAEFVLYVEEPADKSVWTAFEDIESVIEWYEKWELEFIEQNKSDVS